MDRSKIAWTSSTWNPTGGCSRVSAGCENCYAEGVAARFSGEGQAYHGLAVLGARGPRWTGTVRLEGPERLSQPLRWTRPRLIFVNSMSDLFHEKLTNEEIAAVFGVMALARRHTFQALTKRHERAADWYAWARGRGDPGRCCVLLASEHFRGEPAWERAVEEARFDHDYAPPIEWPLKNVWIGVSVENQAAAAARVPALLRTDAAVRFLSVEPLIGPVDLDEWVEHVSHCHACHAENPPQKEDRCPKCGREGVLTDTWGAAQAERCRTGERHDEESAAGRADVAGTSPTIDWAIVGGESGGRARPMNLEWARAVVGQCRAADVPVFVKQLGKTWSVLAGYGARGKADAPEEWPEDLRVREWPAGFAPPAAPSAPAPAEVG